MSKRVEAQDGNISINPVTGAVELYNNDVLVAQTATTGSGGLLVDVGSGLEPIVTASSLPPGLVSGTGTESNNQIAVYTGASAIEGTANLTFNDDVTNSVLEISSLQDAVLRLNADTNNVGENDNAWVEITQDGGAAVAQLGLTGDNDQLPNGDALSNTPINSLALINTFTGGTASEAGVVIGCNNEVMIRIQEEQTTFFISEVEEMFLNASGLRLSESLYLTEKAANSATAGTRGQLWVRDDNPNTLMFTNGDDTDFVLNGSGGVLPAGTATGAMLRWNGSSWIEDDRVQSTGSGLLRVFDSTLNDSIGLTENGANSFLSSNTNPINVSAEGAIDPCAIFTADELTIPVDKQLILELQNDSVTPSLAFGNGDTGLYEAADDILAFSCGEVEASRLAANEVQTNNATPFVVTRIPVASGEGFGFEIHAMATESSTGDTVFERIFGAIRNQGGTTALVGSTITDRTDDAGAAAWVFDVAADDTGDDLTVEVTGEAAHTIDWKVRVTLLNV